MDRAESDDTCEFEYVIEDIAQQLDSIISNEYNEITNRYSDLIDSFNEEFQHGTKFGDVDEYEAALGISARFMRASIILYALGFHGSAIIELHGVLERASIEVCNQILIGNPQEKRISELPLYRQTLNNIKQIMIDLGIWNSNDSEFIKELSEERNRTAHKNPRSTKSSQAHSITELSDVESVVTVNSSYYIVMSTRLLLKLLLHKPK